MSMIIDRMNKHAEEMKDYVDTFPEPEPWETRKKHPVKGPYKKWKTTLKEQ